MYMVDFIFDDIKLSDLGCMIGYGVTSASETVGLGSALSFDLYNNNATFKNQILRAKYETPISITFDIFKDKCSQAEMYFSDKEISNIMKRFNCKMYREFCPIYNDDSFPNIYYKGTFTEITAIIYADKVAGFTLNFTTNSPFGYFKQDDLTYTMSNGGSIAIYTHSDEVGLLYPTKFQFKCTSAGNLTITNSENNGYPTKVNNCVSGEIISFNSENSVITSNKTHAKLFNDFNYNFPVLVNNGNDNVIKVSGVSGVLTLNYEPVKKVGIFV